MRRFSKSVSFAALMLPVLSFAVWWNYAALVMSYPAYKSQLRNWTWRNFGDPFDREARRIAGFRAVNCVPSEKPTGKANRIASCISTARLDERGFRARFNVCGIDSCGAIGLVGSSDGSVYQLAFDVSHGHITLKRRQCDYPLNLAAAEFPNFYLYCLPASHSGDFEVLRRD